MFENFTDRARKVMALANQEAQRLNHEWLGTEHILLGIIKEGSGVGAWSLKNLGINFKEARQEVERLVQPGTDMVTMGKLPKNPRARECILKAIEIAREKGDNHVGTEHLLLGLLSDKESIAQQVIANLLREKTLKDVEDEIDHLCNWSNKDESDLVKEITEKLPEIRPIWDSLKGYLTGVTKDASAASDEIGLRPGEKYEIYTTARGSIYYSKAEFIRFASEGLYFKYNDGLLLINGDYVILSIKKID